MSVFEDLADLQQRVATRLRELEPLVVEYHQLQQMAERLNFEVPSAPPVDALPSIATAAPTSAQASKAFAKPASKPAAKRAAKRATASKRAAKKAPARRGAAGRRRAGATKPSTSRTRPGGTRATGVERRARVLSLIQQRPGITVPEISTELGVDPPPLYRVVRKLQADGVVKKEGKNLAIV